MYLLFNCQAYDFRDSIIVNVMDVLYKLDRHIRKSRSILNLASYSILYYLWSANLSQSLSRSIFSKFIFSLSISCTFALSIFFSIAFANIYLF